jgi:hypothetical protein
VASAQRPEWSWHLRFMKYWGGGQGVSGVGWGVIEARIRVRVSMGKNWVRLFGIGFSCFMFLWRWFDSSKIISYYTGKIILKILLLLKLIKDKYDIIFLQNSHFQYW